MCEQTIDGKDYFDIYNISNRLNPMLTGSTEISLNNTSISIQGNYAYLNDSLQIIDISDKSKPIVVSNAYLSSFDQVNAKKDLIYCTRGESFSIYKSYLVNRAPYIYAGLDRKVDASQNEVNGEVCDEGLPAGG